MKSVAAQWEEKADMVIGRQEIYSATADGAIYVPGGVLNDNSTSDSLEAYIAKEDRWQQLAPMPEARHHITPAIVGKKLYAVAGFSGSYPDWVMQDEMYIYDLDAGTWSHGKPLPAPQGEHVSAVVGNKIHIIGGRAPSGKEGGHFDAYDDTTQHYIYDTAVGEWIEGKPALTARNSAAAAVIDGLIYVVGGRENVEQVDGTQLQHNVGTLEAYSSETDSWKTLSPMPEALGGTTAAVLNGELYVFGGESWAPEHKVFSSAWVYNPKQDAWRKMEDMPTARHGLAAATVGNTIYTFGGCIKVGGGAVVAVTEAIKP